MNFFTLIAVMVASYIITGIVRRVALRRQIIDIPNERSLHKRPTPRGGGIGFVTTFLALASVLWITGNMFLNHFAILLIGGGALAVVGYVDDWRSLTPYHRLAYHIGAAVGAIILLGGMPPLDLGFTVIEWGIVGHLVGVIGIVWLINLYNFMDGIDGIAAGEAVVVAGIVGYWALDFQRMIDTAFSSAVTPPTSIPSEELIDTAASITQMPVGFLAAGLAMACLGFLIWNWQPARIFMGDVGSGFLGYVIAVLALITAHASPIMLWVWLILLAVFITDTLLTLLNRIRRGETWHKAHRSHAHQHATMRYKSHAGITTAVLIINVVWLAPLAWLALSNPQWVLLITALAYVPVIGLALYFRAGIEPYPQT